mmetsp:Transcript_65184/g.146432  ORF Transcript_65184/g.146432 Transcript_65184/m.146432 type:complete len:182 (-) Transcript_65184:34-579(-)
MVLYPVQTGPASEFAKQSARHLLSVLVIQVFVCILRLFFLWDLVGGFIMALTIKLGYWCWREHMNVTCISAWGIINAIEVVYDGLSAILGFFFRLVQFQVLEAVLVVIIPFTELLAVVLAWQIFRDFEARGGIMAPLFGIAQYGEHQPLMDGSGGKERMTRDVNGVIEAPVKKKGNPFFWA